MAPTPKVTSAVLLATAPDQHGEAAATLGWHDGTVVERLLAQLGELGVRSARIITRPGWEQSLRRAIESALPTRVHVSSDVGGDLRAIAAIASEEPGDLLVAAADVVTHREALAGLLLDSRVATGALCATGEVANALSPAARDPHGRLVSAGSAHHSVSRPNASFLGLVKVAAADRPALGEAATRLASLPAAATENAVALALVGLVRSGAGVGAVQLRALYWARPASGREAERAAVEISDLDEDRLLLDSAVKADDSFFTTFLVSPWSKHVARWAARRGWTPNQVTTVSLGIGVLAAIAFASGERVGLIAGALLLQLSFATDCVDGQLARYTRTFSRLGAWLDAVFDRTKEYAVYAGLAIGASASGDPVWILAGAALALQTVRHAVDFSYVILQREQLAAARRPPLAEPGDGRASAQGAAGVWDTVTRRSGIHWAKQFIAFPIGERFAAISITAAVASARTTFVVLLAWGGIATAYKTIGRLVRSVPR